MLLYFMTSICWVLHIHVLNVSKADVNFASHLSDFHVSYLIWNKSTSVKSSFVAKTIVNLSEIIYDIHTMHYFSVILWSLSLISKTVFKMFIQWYDVMKELTFAAFHDGHLVFYSFFLQVKLTCRHTLIICQLDILDWQVSILVWQVGIIIWLLTNL